MGARSVSANSAADSFQGKGNREANRTELDHFHHNTGCDSSKVTAAKENTMKAGYKFSAIASTLSLTFCLSLLSVNAAAQGSITGTVKLNGTPPHMRGIDMSKDPYCVQQHTNAPVSMETVVMGSGGGLENVVLYISEGLPANLASSTPSEVPVFDQKGCMYTPHVLAMDVKQKYKIKTSDQTTHNIHPLPDATTGNIPWNKSQPPGAPPIEAAWKAEEVAIPVK